MCMSKLLSPQGGFLFESFNNTMYYAQLMKISYLNSTKINYVDNDYNAEGNNKKNNSVSRNKILNENTYNHNKIDKDYNKINDFFREDISVTESSVDDDSIDYDINNIALSNIEVNKINIEIEFENDHLNSIASNNMNTNVLFQEKYQGNIIAINQNINFQNCENSYLKNDNLKTHLEINALNSIVKQVGQSKFFPSLNKTPQNNSLHYLSSINLEKNFTSNLNALTSQKPNLFQLSNYQNILTNDMNQPSLSKLKASLPLLSNKKLYLSMISQNRDFFFSPIMDNSEINLIITDKEQQDEKVKIEKLKHNHIINSLIELNTSLENKITLFNVSANNKDKENNLIEDDTKFDFNTSILMLDKSVENKDRLFYFQNSEENSEEDFLNIKNKSNNLNFIENESVVTLNINNNVLISSTNTNDEFLIKYDNSSSTFNLSKRLKSNLIQPNLNNVPFITEFPVNDINYLNHSNSSTLLSPETFDKTDETSLYLDISEPKNVSNGKISNLSPLNQSLIVECSTLNKESSYVKNLANTSKSHNNKNRTLETVRLNLFIESLSFNKYNLTDFSMNKNNVSFDSNLAYCNEDNSNRNDLDLEDFENTLFYNEEDKNCNILNKSLVNDLNNIKYADKNQFNEEESNLKNQNNFYHSNFYINCNNYSSIPIQTVKPFSIKESIETSDESNSSGIGLDYPDSDLNDSNNSPALSQDIELINSTKIVTSNGISNICLANFKDFANSLQETYSGKLKEIFNDKKEINSHFNMWNSHDFRDSDFFAKEDCLTLLKGSFTQTASKNLLISVDLINNLMEEDMNFCKDNFDFNQLESQYIKEQKMDDTFKSSYNSSDNEIMDIENINISEENLSSDNKNFSNSNFIFDTHLEGLVTPQKDLIDTKIINNFTSKHLENESNKQLKKCELIQSYSEDWNATKYDNFPSEGDTDCEYYEKENYDIESSEYDEEDVDFIEQKYQYDDDDDDDSVVFFDIVQNNQGSKFKKRVSFSAFLQIIPESKEWCNEILKDARCGPWEEYARDRCRFLRRIDEEELNLSWIFYPNHRKKIKKILLNSILEMDINERELYTYLNESNLQSD